MQVCVLGVGIMGSGIAQLAAMAQDTVVAYDVDQAALDRAAHSIEVSLGRFVKAEKISQTDSLSIRERITFTTDLSHAVAHSDVVMEASPEIPELKKELWTEVSSLAPPRALLGTNTSQLSITSIAAAMGDEAPRLVGIHFFNPPVMMRLVEVIAGLRTSSAAVERAKDFGVHLGKEVVVCRKDSPGFITSRAYAILRLECVRMLEEGVATAEDIDTALKLGFNFPMGPLELGDMNGIDTYVHALSGLAEAHGDRFRPTVGLKNMVAANQLGRKTRSGFYSYDEDGKRTTQSSTPLGTSE